MTTNDTPADLSLLLARLNDGANRLAELRQQVAAIEAQRPTAKVAAGLVLAAMQKLGPPVDDAMAAAAKAAEQVAGVVTVRRNLAFGGVGPAKFT